MVETATVHHCLHGPRLEECSVQEYKTDERYKYNALADLYGRSPVHGESVLSVLCRNSFNRPM